VRFLFGFASQIHIECNVHCEEPNVCHATADQALSEDEYTVRAQYTVAPIHGGGGALRRVKVST